MDHQKMTAMQWMRASADHISTREEIAIAMSRDEEVRHTTEAAFERAIWELQFALNGLLTLMGEEETNGNLRTQEG